MNSYSSNLVDVAKSKLIAWALVLSMLASGVAVRSEEMGRSLDSLIVAAQKAERHSRQAIRYSIWLYHLYRVNAERQSNPGVKAS